jgi:hypothetical protein
MYDTAGAPQDVFFAMRYKQVAHCHAALSLVQFQYSPCSPYTETVTEDDA